MVGLQYVPKCGGQRKPGAFNCQGSGTGPSIVRVPESGTSLRTQDGQEWPEYGKWT